MTSSNRSQVLEERVDSSGDADRQFVWGVRYVDDLVLRDRDAAGGGDLGVSGSGLDERLYALTDALYNVVALINTSGAVQERFLYDPYGKSKELNPDFTSYTGSDYNWEHRFTGRRLDLDTGLQLNRNRYYHNALGRWANRDPIGYRGGINLYEYVVSQPSRFVDPWGLTIITIGFPEDTVTEISDWWNWLITNECVSFDPNDPDWERVCKELDDNVSDGTVTHVIFNGHGCHTSFGPFTEENIADPTSEEYRFLEELKKKIKKPCTIDIRCCYVGGNRSFMTALAKKLGCKIKCIDDQWAVVPHGTEYEYSPDGTRKITAERAKRGEKKGKEEKKKKKKKCKKMKVK